MAGRPKKEIDYRIVKECSELFCSQETIATILGISTRTLQKDDEFLRIYCFSVGVVLTLFDLESLSINQYDYSSHPHPHLRFTVLINTALREAEKRFHKKASDFIPIIDRVISDIEDFCRWFKISNHPLQSMTYDKINFNNKMDQIRDTLIPLLEELNHSKQQLQDRLNKSYQ